MIGEGELEVIGEGELDVLEEESWEMVEREWLWRDGCWEGEEPGPLLPLHQLGPTMHSLVYELKELMMKMVFN